VANAGHVTDEQLRDPLTGLLRGWWSNPEGEVDASAQWLSAMSPETWVLGIRIVDFGALLDDHGVAFGDRLLAETGRRLLRASDPWPAYLGEGPEFIVATRASEVSMIEALAASLRSALQEPIEGVVIKIRMVAVQATEAENSRDVALMALRILVGPTGSRSALVIVRRGVPRSATATESGDASPNSGADADRRDSRTGLRYWRGSTGQAGSLQVQPWLASMPADGVIIAISIRGFKPVNDRYGMGVGDRVLSEFARRLQEGAQPWVAYRDGGDEFIVAARLDGEAAIRAFVETIRSSLERPYEGGISVGTWAAAAMALPGQYASELVDAAGFAQWQSKGPERSELLVVPPGSDGRPPFGSLSPI
jgi:diguanylate cyclase (GGDEF)-like protein